MKTIALFTLLLALNLNAQNLEEILGALKESKKVKVILEKTKSEIAQNEMSTSYEAPELGLGVAQIEDSVENGVEYSIEFTQNILHPFSSSKKQKGIDLLGASINQELKHKIHVLELDAILRYHKTCVSKEMQEKAEVLYAKQNNRYQQIKKAYDLGEISKKNLLFNKLDLLKLKQRQSGYKNIYLMELLNLQEAIDNLSITSVSCNDLFELKEDIELFNISEHSELKKVEYQKRSTRALYDVYDSTFQSIGYGVGFEQELDAQRFSISLNIPLNSLSSQNEKQKAQYLHMNSAYNVEKDSLQKQIESRTNLLQLNVKSLYNRYSTLYTEILPLNLELANLSKLAYSEGEGTIMEYLDATRSYSENLLEMLEIKKNYYVELFKLYKEADIKLGENYDKNH